MNRYMMHIKSAKTVKLSVFLILLFVSGLSLAQPEVDSEPTSDTEIICYAAQQQWVCAPADQKQQAHEKAMQLVEQKQSTEEINSSKVRIKTMDVSNDFNQQVQESPASNSNQRSRFGPQVKDFIPRVDSNNLKNLETGSNINQAPVKVQDPVEKNSSETVVDTQTTIDKSAPTLESTSSQGSSNDFEYWQKNYSEKWSFQVIGTSNRHHLNEFIAQHDLFASQYSIVKTQVNSADWWVVLVGLYDSRELALSQRNQLPFALSEQAWVRQIKTITGEAD